MTALVLICAAAVNVKFSGVLLGPMVVVLLIWRALSAEPWEWLGRMLGLGAALSFVVAVVVMGALALTWRHLQVGAQST